MFSRMCNVSLKVMKSTAELRGQLGNEPVRVALHRGRLRSGYWKREENSWVRKCMSMNVEGGKGGDGPKKTRGEVKREALKLQGFSRESAQDCTSCRTAIR